jgi:hypothetical protein
MRNLTTKLGAVAALALVAIGQAQTFTWAGTELDAAEGAVTGLLALGGVIFVGYALFHMTRKGTNTAKRS